MDDHFRHGAGALPILFRLLVRLPLPLLQATGRLLGKLAYAAPGRYRERLRANAASGRRDRTEQNGRAQAGRRPHLGVDLL